ncbi:ISL3 family transposase [Paenibacillus xylaniclasticus]|uniref:ISL3 family transposase n=1 Tax=Paenibacillus xylaniclasticus TaxID=588083 RepID=UPI000FD7C385|nr:MULTISPECIES: ISL3 family transposase [Paenibacillus]GFN32488.1 ISL3 family transposase [Paenibacillus curdlanolyticus]
MLNIPEFNVIQQEQNEHFYRFTVECKEPPYMCTSCGWINRSDEDAPDMAFRPHQVKERTVSDIAMHGKAVRIVIRHRRYKCPACGGTFYEWLNSVERNDKVTKRFKEHIQLLSLKRPFTNVADEYGLSHTSVKRYFEEFVVEKDDDKYIQAPRVLGIDEAHLNKVMRGVFTDTENFKLLEISKDNTKKTVKEVIQSMRGYEKIEVATIDMAAGYKYAIQELIPKCFIVIDKFHVVKYAQEALRDIRVTIKKGLTKEERKLLTKDRWLLHSNKENLSWNEALKRNEIFERFPLLKQAYWLKEGVRDVYNQSKNKQEALERFAKWESEIPKEFKEFKAIRRTFNNHKEEIFNYFEHPFTNAFTESMNNIIKSVEKEGKGYSFDVLRAKVLYGTEATIKKPKYDHDMEFKSFSFESEEEFNRYYDEVENKFVSLGVDLTTLSEVLERGDF